MKYVSPIIVFALSFLAGLEAVLYFNLNANFTKMIPVAFLFAAVVTLLRKPAIHQYRMLFDAEYKRYQTRKRRHHRHKRSHSMHTSH